MVMTVAWRYAQQRPNCHLQIVHPDGKYDARYQQFVVEAAKKWCAGVWDKPTMEIEKKKFNWLALPLPSLAIYELWVAGVS